MSDRSLAPKRPQIILDSFKPVSVFLCPCRVRPEKLTELEKQAASTGKGNTDGLFLVQLQPFEEKCLGLRANFQPHLFFLKDLCWAVIALVTELHPDQGASISFEQLLAFNSNLRVCQGGLERRDTPVVGAEKLEFTLSGGRGAAQIFRRIAEESLGAYEPPEALKRTVTLTIASFDRTLDNSELYALGTIAHSDEMIDTAWAEETAGRQGYDRWRSLGIRYFVHSYSLACACAAPGEIRGSDLAATQKIFLKDYVEMGVRLALERADSLDLRAAIQAVRDLKELRRQREKWIDSRRILGVRWTAEGTQKAQIEELWRRVSGLEKMSEEIDRRFSQTVDLFEAQAEERHNTLLTWFEIFVVGFAVAEVTAVLTAESGPKASVPWTLAITVLAMFLCWLGLYYGVIRRSGRKK